MIKKEKEIFKLVDKVIFELIDTSKNNIMRYQIKEMKEAKLQHERKMEEEKQVFQNVLKLEKVKNH